MSSTKLVGLDFALFDKKKFDWLDLSLKITRSISQMYPKFIFVRDNIRQLGNIELGLE